MGSSARTLNEGYMLNKKNGLMSTIKTGLIALFLILLSVVLTSCGPPLSTRASQVHLVNVEQIRKVVNQCDFLGNVRGSALFPYCCVFSWGFLGDTFYAGALNELMDNAAELGASHVFVNMGDGPFLIGEAYFCAFCIGPEGKPDEAFCMGEDGRRDVGFCEDQFANPVGTASCKGATGNDRNECKANGGKWIPALDQPTCEKQGNTWMPGAADEKACEDRGGTWLPKAIDKKACEEKGSTWAPNKDVTRDLEDK